MSVQAFLTGLGGALCREELYPTRTAWFAARHQEKELLRALEEQLSGQLGAPVRLAGTVLDGSEPPGGDAADLMLGETVGGSDGLAPLQGFAISMVLDGRPPADLRYDDAYLPLRRARETGFHGPLASFRHLLDHDPLEGYYLPLDFPEPLAIPGAVRGEASDISFGSASRLASELDRWRALARAVTLPDWLLGHYENLALVTRAALRTGLAMAIT